VKKSFSTRRARTNVKARFVPERRSVGADRVVARVNDAPLAGALGAERVGAATYKGGGPRGSLGAEETSGAGAIASIARQALTTRQNRANRHLSMEYMGPHGESTHTRAPPGSVPYLTPAPAAGGALGWPHAPDAAEVPSGAHEPARRSPSAQQPPVAAEGAPRARLAPGPAGPCSDAVARAVAVVGAAGRRGPRGLEPPCGALGTLPPPEVVVKRSQRYRPRPALDAAAAPSEPRTEAADEEGPLRASEVGVPFEALRALVGARRGQPLAAAVVEARVEAALVVEGAKDREPICSARGNIGDMSARVGAALKSLATVVGKVGLRQQHTFPQQSPTSGRTEGDADAW